MVRFVDGALLDAGMLTRALREPAPGAPRWLARRSPARPAV